MKLTILYPLLGLIAFLIIALCSCATSRPTTWLNEAKEAAPRWAKARGVELARDGAPTQIIVYDSLHEMNADLDCPDQEYDGLVTARIDLDRGIIYLGRLNRRDLYVEMGKWAAYPVGYEWGLDRAADLKLLATAEEFADFVEGEVSK